jgi:hypothetical protein
MKRAVFALLFVFAACERPSTPSAESRPDSSVTPTPAPVTPAVPVVTGPKLMPVDEATNDPTLVAFRTQILDIVRRKDVAALLALVDPKIRTSFGGGGGTADLRRQWKLDEPDSQLWNELDEIFRNGGRFQQGGDTPRFWAPYVYSAWPDSHDAFTHFAVLGQNVPLRSGPTEAAPPIATLSYDIVEGIDSAEEHPADFRRIRTADKREGWVAAKSIRSPIGYRAGVVKKPEGWRIEALVAGD